MTFTEMQQAVSDAQATIGRADRYVSEMAEMIAGRLKIGNVSHYTLGKLKRELADYNLHTMQWKERP